MRKLFVCVFTLIVSPGLFSTSTVACTCDIKPPPCYEYWRSDAVFVGKIVKVHGNADYPIGTIDDKVEVEIVENFKGMNRKSAITYNSGTSCSFTYREGSQYLFYAGTDKDDPAIFGTGFCSRTGIFSDSIEDLDFLRSLHQRKSILELWGSVATSSNQPLAGVKAEFTIGNRIVRRVSDSSGYLRMDVPQAGKYKVRVFIPENMEPIPPARPEHFGLVETYNMEARPPYIDYKVEVTSSKCGWFPFQANRVIHQ